jgi:hypothetical protein
MEMIVVGNRNTFDFPWIVDLVLYGDKFGWFISQIGGYHNSTVFI